jgi:excisionase family DNA binding protein
MTRLLSVPEVADRFSVTNQTVRNWIASGRLVAIQTARRGRYRIREEDSMDLERSMSVAVGGDWHEELDRVVNAIVGAVAPDSVYLFGSRARGDAGAESDLDIAVIVPDGSPRRRIAMRSYESLTSVPHRTVGVDVVVLTPAMIAVERDLVGSICRAIVTEGVPVYGRIVA